MGDLNCLKELVFQGDNEACFIERERILDRLDKEFRDYDGPDKFALIFSKMMAEVSTPVEACDFFAGRVVEAKPDAEMVVPNHFLGSTGHMSPDYESLLKYGLVGILEKIKKAAKYHDDEDSISFARNAEIVVYAVKGYAERYAGEARRKGFACMAQALEKVPFEPAYDFYSALQSIWLMHMIASCYVGERDYAFGRFDEYMLPFYEKAVSDGMSEEEITTLLAGFFIKTNEICGRGACNYHPKPIPCQSSKQYVNIGGEKPNAFSSVVLKAAVMNNMAQPQITVLLKPNANENFTNDVFAAMCKLVDKLHLYNYDLIVNSLIKKGIAQEDAKQFTFSACCTFDLNFYSYRLEYYAPVLQIFLDVMNQREYADLETMLTDLTAALEKDIQRDIDIKEKSFSDRGYARKYFLLDCLLHTETAYNCLYPCDGNSKYKIFNVFCPGIATLGDSLMALDRFVFKSGRYSYHEFVNRLNNNYENCEELRQEILSCTRFGNDSEADQYTVMAANCFLDAVDNLSLKENEYVIGGFYSLDRDNTWKVKATPDGRKNGEPFSENQSPSYGADKNGITALLKSLSKLPFGRTATGGLNLTFSQNVSSNVLKALVLSYFQLGGLHVGISVVDAEVLKDAMRNPDKYKSLTVRLYGFSEYFVSLPAWQQIAVINRTAYNVQK